MAPHGGSQPVQRGPQRSGQGAAQADLRGTPVTGGLVNQVAFVTGGGRGLGAAICTMLAAEGMRVVVADLDAAAAQQTMAAIAGQGGVAQAMPLDVGDAAAVETAVTTLLEREGRLDVLVNNAGIDVTAPLTDLAVADWERILRTNLTGPFLLSRAVIGPMLRGGGGQIVNIASTAARRAWPNAAAYHATKWGLLGLSHALHAELRGQGIKVSAVLAGGMRTPFLLDRFPDLDVTRLQDPAHVAAAVRFVLTQPAGTVVPEVMVLPVGEDSWP